MTDRWYQIALDFVNKVRLDIQLPPVDKLEKGIPSDGANCPISRSIKIGRDNIVVNTVPYLNGKFGYSSIPGSVEIGSPNSCRRRVYILKADVSHFVRRFDNGYYRDLLDEGS